MNRRALFLRALKATVPVWAGYTVLGAAYGMLMSSRGFPVYITFLTSLIVFAGSLQFACIDLLATGAGLLTVLITSLTVNARHLFYGLSVAERYNKLGKSRPYLICALTDETYSLVAMPQQDLTEEEQGRFCLYVTGLDHFYWTAGSVLGALVFGLVSPNTAGMDFALTGLFLTVCIDQWKDRGGHLSACIGAGATLLCRLLFGASAFLIPAALVILAALYLLYRRETGAGREETER